MKRRTDKKYYSFNLSESEMDSYLLVNTRTSDMDTIFACEQYDPFDRYEDPLVREEFVRAARRIGAL